MYKRQDLLDEIIEQIEKGGTKKARTQKTINIGVDTLPMFPLDASDRNRTSPCLLYTSRCV